MMVPSDGKYFFANDTLNSALNFAATPQPKGTAK
jgi:hypothetical protein